MAHVQGLNNANEVDFEATWDELASAFREIHTKNASKLSFEHLYRNAYKLVLRKKGEDLYHRVADFESDWLGNEVRRKIQQFLSAELLNDSQESTQVNATQRKESEKRFLKELRQSWEDHQVSMSMLTDVLMYMDRVYCADTRQPSIYSKAMSIFRDQILRARVAKSQDAQQTILNMLVYIILDQIRMDRDGDDIDKSLIKSNVYMLEALYQSDLEAEGDRLYLQTFEQAFLHHSVDFYRNEGEQLLRDADAGSYCRHARRRITEEEDRCRSTLSETTTSKIVKVVEDELIRNKIKNLIEMESGVQFMINNDRLDDLGLVFDLEARVDPRKTELTRALQKIVAEMGTNINNAALTVSQAQAAPPNAAAAGEDGEDKPKAGAGVNQQTFAALKWVEDVLGLKDKFDLIWTRAFEKDQVLQTSLTRSMSDVINNFARCSEYISLFIDDNMKKGIKGKTEEEVDAVLDKAIILLRYIQDKDMFEMYYKRHLCRRLLMQKSLSIDTERAMVSRMKLELGNSFTMKLESMFKDMDLSEELTAGYRKYVSGLGDVETKRTELTASILTSMTWPLDTMRGHDDEKEAKMKTIYPPTIEKIKASFEQFYAQRYSGRVLTWHGNLGTADIKATFPKVPSKDGPKTRVHELNVSTFAMVVLMLFNDLAPGESISFEDIQAQTNIPTNELVRNLQSLAVAPKTRILLKEPMSKDVKPTDRFIFNESFQGKFVKIKVGVVSAGNRVENDKERKETEKKNNDSRGFVVEAAIVRIMKQRKELSHAQLVTETLTQLSSQFKPDVTMIKKKIESLIEREYLERMEEAPVPSYRYLA